MSDLTDLLHRLAAAIFRPADHALEDLHAEIDKLEGAPDPAVSVTPDPAPGAQPSEPDTPAVFPTAPAPFGSESQPEGASFPAQPESD